MDASEAGAVVARGRRIAGDQAAPRRDRMPSWSGRPDLSSGAAWGGAWLHAVGGPRGPRDRVRPRGRRDATDHVPAASARTTVLTERCMPVGSGWRLPPCRYRAGRAAPSGGDGAWGDRPPVLREPRRTGGVVGPFAPRGPGLPLLVADPGLTGRPRDVMSGPGERGAAGHEKRAICVAAGGLGRYRGDRDRQRRHPGLVWSRRTRRAGPMVWQEGRALGW